MCCDLPFFLEYQTQFGCQTTTAFKADNFNSFKNVKVRSHCTHQFLQLKNCTSNMLMECSKEIAKLLGKTLV